MKTNAILVAVLAVLMSAGRLSQAAQYSVNAGPEAGVEQVKSPTDGLAKLKNPGDVLTIGRGLYAVGSLEITGLKGTEAAPIIIRGVRLEMPADLPGQPKIDKSQYGPLLKAAKDNALVVRDCSYLRIEGLLVTGAKELGISLENCDHVTLKDCLVFDCGRTQVQAKGGDHVTIEDCELSGGVLGHGCRLWASNQPVVRGCLIHHNSSCGVYIHGDKKIGDGMLAEPLVEANTLFANGKLKQGGSLPKDEKGNPIRPATLRYGPAAVAGDGVAKGIFRNNLIYRNAAGGIVLFRDEAIRAGQKNSVLHNTIYLSADFDHRYGICLGVASQDCSILNNIVVTALGPALLLDQGASRDLKSDYNILFRLDNKEPCKREKEELSLGRWQELLRLDRNSVLLKVPFVDPDNPDLDQCDYQLTKDATKDSNLAGKCPFVADAPTTLTGAARPADRVTPGCYELAPTGNSPHQTPASRRTKPTTMKDSPPVDPAARPNEPEKPKDGPPRIILPPM